jgi:superfamily I DNA/RNA helicase
MNILNKIDDKNSFQNFYLTAVDICKNLLNLFNASVISDSGNTVFHVQTFHSFCYDLVRKLNSDFSILSESKSDVLRQSAVEKVMCHLFEMQISQNVLNSNQNSDCYEFFLDLQKLSSFYETERDFYFMNFNKISLFY